MKQLGFFIALSLLFHFLVTTSTLYVVEKLNLDEQKAKPIQIDVITPDKKDDLHEKLEQTRQLVKQLKTTVAKIQNDKIKARFESEQTQRVEKETRATKLGLTQNAGAASQPKQLLPPTKITPQPEDQKVPPKNQPKDGDLPEFARFKSSPMQVQASQQSAISNDLPSEIQQSNATNLNTDANTYYSFYSRIEELFYVRWVERNNYYWNRISMDFKRNTLAGKTWSTDVEIWLTSTGEFHSAYIKKPSGYQPFDEAAVFAFKDTKLFPN
ncbi:MAG: energy transducer TonB family protein, partial [Pseudobdellovibrio sp.]